MFVSHFFAVLSLACFLLPDFARSRAERAQSRAQSDDYLYTCTLYGTQAALIDFSIVVAFLFLVLERATPPCLLVAALRLLASRASNN